MELKHHPDKVGRGDFIKLPPASIKIDPKHNIRDMTSERTRAHIEELKISIRAFGGVKEPIEVRVVGNDAFVTDGECRVTAVMEMIRDEGFECDGIACIKEPAGTDDKERLLNFGVSGTKERYNELELAEWCRRCDRANIPHDKIAAAAGWKSTGSVTHHLNMLEILPEPVKQEVRDNKISAGLALQVTKEHGPDQAMTVINAAKAQAKPSRSNPKKPARATPRAVARVTGKSSRTKTNEHFIDFVAVANKMDDVVKLAGGLDKVAPDTIKALVSENITTLAKAKGRRVEAPHDAERETDRAIFDEQNPRTAAVHPSAPETPVVVPEPFDPIDRQYMSFPPGSEWPTSSPTPPSALAAPQNQIPHHNGVKDLIDALKPFADLCNDFDANAKSDDDLVEVFVRDVKRAWEVYTAATGGSEEEAA